MKVGCKSRRSVVDRFLEYRNFNMPPIFFLTKHCNLEGDSLPLALGHGSCRLASMQVSEDHVMWFGRLEKVFARRPSLLGGGHR